MPRYAKPAKNRIGAWATRVSVTEHGATSMVGVGVVVSVVVLLALLETSMLSFRLPVQQLVLLLETFEVALFPAGPEHPPRASDRHSKNAMVHAACIFMPFKFSAKRRSCEL